MWTTKCGKCKCTVEKRDDFDCTQAVTCEKCKTTCYMIFCPYCKLINMVPDNFNGQCYSCHKQITYIRTAGFFSSLFCGRTKCPACGRTEGVTGCPEYVAAVRNNLVTDWYEGGIYPQKKVGYQTDYLCNCGHVWCTRRVEEGINYG